MTTPLPELDARLAALRESIADEAPPPSTDRAVAAAMARAGRARRVAGSAPTLLRRFDAWLAWPLALAASITLLSLVIRSVPPQSAPDADPHAPVEDLPRTASFMPVVPLAELERAGDALVVPARMSRMSLAEFGLPVNPARAADTIDTELLVRPDGAVLALRFAH